MERIGIIVAMEKELRLLQSVLDDSRELQAGGFNFYLGNIGTREVVAMQCGIGKVNAAMGALTMIDTFHTPLIINTGVAGGVGHTHPLDVVVAQRVAYHDTYCGPGTQWGEIQGMPRYFEAPESLVEAAMQCSPKARKGLLVSGDFFVSTPQEVERILAVHPEAMAVDMESAAMAQVCHRKGVAFMSVRVVSDTPGVADNSAQYTNFWEAAPATTFDLLRHLLAKL